MYLVLILMQIYFPISEYYLRREGRGDNKDTVKRVRKFKILLKKLFIGLRPSHIMMMTWT